MSGRPSPFTSATAAPAYQPYGASSAAVVKVPLPLFQRTSTPVAVRDDEVGVAVAVQVGRDAARALHPDAGVRRAVDVHEPPVHVLEERALRQAAAALPLGHVDVGIRVHREEIEPPVVVVVEPADSAAHHRLLVVGHRVAEGALPEVEPELRRDVDQAELREGAGALRQVQIRAAVATARPAAAPSPLRRRSGSGRPSAPGRRRARTPPACPADRSRSPRRR